MDIRDQIQKKLTQTILEKKDLLLYVSIRLGKTKIALDAIEIMDRVLWIYPSNAMVSGYQEDLEKFPPVSNDITFTNISSIKKYKDTVWDLVVVDEPQRCQSAAQLKVLATIRSRKRVGLSGTLNAKTLVNLKEKLNWKVSAQYTLEDGIRDGLVKDYKIFIHFSELCNTNKNIEYKKYGKMVMGTEKEAYAAYCSTMDYFQKAMDEAQVFERWSDVKSFKLGFMKYMSLRTNLLYNSKCLMVAAENLVNRFKDQKALIYTLRTDVADKLSTQSYHTKNRDDETLEWFRSSTDGHLGVVDCVTTGITIKNLNTVIFHSYDSNTENFHQKLGRSLLYEFAGEEANVHVCALKDTQNELWIEKACSSLDINKIFYVIDDEVDTKINWIKKWNPEKELYLVKGTGSIVFYAGTNENGFAEYSFLNITGKTYTYSSFKLQAL